MDVASAVSNIRTIQSAFAVLTAVQLTAYLFPQQASVDDGSTYDFIVVGAGSAGCVVASRLTEGGQNSVLLIEAGDDPPIESMLPGELSFLQQSHVDWNYTSVNDHYSGQYKQNEVFALTRGKMLGGTSGLNFMAYVRGNPHDFDTWADIVKDSNWEYKNVLPYFEKSERLEDATVRSSKYGRYHGYSGYLGVQRQYHKELEQYLQAFKEVGKNIVLDTSTGDLGYTQPLFTISNGTRQSTSYAFLSPIKDRNNLHVLKNTLATKIIFDDNKNAIAVEALTENDKKITVRAKKEIIVSAGTINSPQLLMLSGIGPKQHLEEMDIPVISDLPVGKNFCDHQTVLLPILMGKQPSSQPPPNPHDFPSPVFLGYVAVNKSQTYPDYQSLNLLVKDKKSVLGFCSSSFGFNDNICQTLSESSEGREVLFSLVSLMHPKSRGEVLLKSRDPKEYPLIYPGYFSNPDDVSDISDCIEDFIDVFNTTYYEEVESKLVEFDLPTCANLERGSREYWKCYSVAMVLSLYHYVGTCSMGTVVDAQCNVIGVKRLRVADASVIPHITSGNTNAPTIMVGERVSDMIKDCWNYKN